MISKGLFKNVVNKCADICEISCLDYSKELPNIENTGAPT